MNGSDPCAEARAALASSPDDPAAAEALGRCLVEADRIQEAEEVFSALLATSPNLATARSLLAAALVRMGRTEEARAQAAVAVAADPDCAEAHLQRCWIERRAGNLELAITAGHQAIELNPIPDAFNYLCFALLSDDQIDDALAMTERCLETDPRNIAALHYRTSALAAAGRTEEGRWLSDFERFMWMDRLSSVEGYANLSRFNQALSEQVIAAPGRQLDPLQTEDLMDPPRGPSAAFQRVVNAATKMYLRRLPEADPAHPFLRYQPTAWRIHAWGTRVRDLQLQEHHIHQHAWISGVYYAKVPASIGQDRSELGGCIEFARFLRYSDRDVQTEAAVLAPEEGMIVMFPAYFPHRVLPFHSEDTRISVAFNIIPLD